MILEKDKEVNADGKKMTHGSVGVLVAATALCLCFGACVGQQWSVQWTLFSKKKPWSAGQMVCEMMGGYLASLDTPHKLNAFVYFLNHSPWSSSLTAGAYIGLVKQNETSSRWCWLGNCSLSVDSLLGTTLRNESCVSLSSSRPYTNPCTNANEYVCETQKVSGPCTYEEMQDTIGAADIKYTEEYINHLTLTSGQQEVECKTLCDVRGVDCWAVAVVAGTYTCRTYQTSSPFFFDDKSKVMSEIGSTLYIKRCYTASLSSASFDFIQYKTVSPAAPCSSDQRARVYILVMKPATAQWARDQCLAMKYKLAGPNVTSDREKMVDIINSFYPEIVDLSDPLWIDLQTIVGSSPMLFHLDNGSFSTIKELKHPFLCETHKPCTYIVRNSTCSVGVENTTTTTTSKRCMELCTQRNLSNGQCVSCSFSSNSSTCTLYSSNNSVTTVTAATPCDIYCWSCVHVVLQQNIYSQEIITNEEVTETNVLTKSINIQDITTSGTQILSISKGDINTRATTRGDINTPGSTTEGSNMSGKHVQDTNISDTLTGGSSSSCPSEASTNTPGTTTEGNGHWNNSSTSSDRRDFSHSPTDNTEPGATSPPPTATEVPSSRKPAPGLGEGQSTGSKVKRSFYCPCKSTSKLVVSKQPTTTIVKELTVEKNSTYMWRLRYVSVNDRRPSSQTMGVVSVLILSIFLAVIVVVDCISVFRDLDIGQNAIPFVDAN